VDLSKMTRAEFDERLGQHSAKSLRSMAADHGIVLPVGVSDKRLILDAIHTALGAKTSAPASGAPPAPPPSGASEAPDAGPRFSVLCVSGNSSVWRYGHKFTSTWQSIPVSRFPAATWDAIRKDKLLRVK